jgi:hypothetical protein
MIGQYYLLPITLLLIILYILTYFLYTDKTITEHSYKLVWIIILIVSSVTVAITGMVMEIFINLEMLPIDGTLIFWHVEAGILTLVTGIFHLHINWKKFLNYL